MARHRSHTTPGDSRDMPVAAAKVSSVRPWATRAAAVGLAASVAAMTAFGQAPIDNRASGGPSPEIIRLADDLGVKPAALIDSGVTDAIASVIDGIIATEGLGVALGWLGIQFPDVFNEILGFDITGDGVTISTVGPIPSLLKFIGANSLWIPGTSS